MYCPKCGALIEDDAAQCPNCGAQIRENPNSWHAAPADDASEAEQPAGEEDKPSQPEPEEETAQTAGTEETAETEESAYSEKEAASEETADTRDTEKQSSGIRRPLIIVIAIVIIAVSIYALSTMWRDEEAEEETQAADEAAKAAEEEAGEAGEAEDGAGEDTQAGGSNIVIENENPADAYELEAFEDSWSVIRQHGLDGGEKYFREFVESVYDYSNLSFTLQGETLEDLDDYYYIEAIFNKPIMVPVYLSEGDTYDIETDELRGTVSRLTCIGSDPDSDYLEDEDGRKYYCDETGSDRMAELYREDGERMEAPFYDGVLRILKNAVTGDAATHGPYTQVTEADFAKEDLWFNIVAFDGNGYVKQLIYDEEE